MIEEEGGSQSWNFQLKSKSSKLRSRIKIQDGQPRTQSLQWRPVSAAGCGKLIKDALCDDDQEDEDDDEQVGQQEREEEEEDREEARRIDAELAQRLEGAFDDLDFDDDDDSSLCSPPGEDYHFAAALLAFLLHCRSASSPWLSNGYARRAAGGFEVSHLNSLQCCLLAIVWPNLFCTLHAHLSVFHGSYKPVQHSCLWSSSRRLPGATAVPAASDCGGDQLGNSCLR